MIAAGASRLFLCISLPDARPEVAPKFVYAFYN